jgi:deazaflavin-dependent oxidoreductase (nitroreductase family)
MNIIFKLVTAFHVWLYRKSGGKRGARMADHDLVLLTTKGRKSGMQRDVVIVSFEDGADRVVVASKGGAPSDPAWFVNLKADSNVTVQLGPEVYAAKAVVVPPDERDRLWKKVVSEMPNFGEYEKKTTRVIQLVRLVRAA